jgi:hypothetical protein
MATSLQMRRLCHIRQKYTVANSKETDLFLPFRM